MLGPGNELCWHSAPLRWIHPAWERASTVKQLSYPKLGSAEFVRFPSAAQHKAGCVRSWGPALCSVCLGSAGVSRNRDARSSQHSWRVTQAGTCHGRLWSLFRCFSMFEDSVLASEQYSVLPQQNDRHPLWLEAKLDRLVSETSSITENTLLAAISVCDIGEGVFKGFCFSEKAK